MYRSLNIVRVIKSRSLRWAGHIARMEDGRSAFKMLTGTTAGKKPLGRPRYRREDNIRVSLKEVGINTRNWIVLFQDRDQVSYNKNICRKYYSKYERSTENKILKVKTTELSDSS